MGVAYCSVGEVQAVATKYFNSQLPDITDSQVEAFIADASDEIRRRMQPAYDPDTIDAYDPDFPPLITMAAKLQAAIYLYNRAGSANYQSDSIIVGGITRDYGRVLQAIHDRSLLDTLGAAVPTDQAIVTLSDGYNAVLDATTRIARYSVCD